MAEPVEHREAGCPGEEGRTAREKERGGCVGEANETRGDGEPARLDGDTLSALSPRPTRLSGGRQEETPADRPVPRQSERAKSSPDCLETAERTGDKAKERRVAPAEADGRLEKDEEEQRQRYLSEQQAGADVEELEGGGTRTTGEKRRENEREAEGDERETVKEGGEGSSSGGVSRRPKMARTRTKADEAEPSSLTGSPVPSAPSPTTSSSSPSSSSPSSSSLSSSSSPSSSSLSSSSPSSSSSSRPSVTSCDAACTAETAGSAASPAARGMSGRCAGRRRRLASLSPLNFVEGSPEAVLASPGEPSESAEKREGGRRRKRRLRPSSPSESTPLDGPAGLSERRRGRRSCVPQATPLGTNEDGGDLEGAGERETPSSDTRREKKAARMLSPAAAGSQCRQRTDATLCCPGEGLLFDEGDLDRTLRPTARDAPWRHPLWPPRGPLPPCVASASATDARETWEAFFSQWLHATFAGRVGEPSGGGEAEEERRGEAGIVSAASRPSTPEASLPRLTESAAEKEELMKDKEEVQMQCQERVGSEPHEIRSLFNCLLYGHPDGLFDRCGTKKRRRARDVPSASGEMWGVLTPAADPSASEERQKWEEYTKDGTEKEINCFQSVTPCRLFFSPAPPPPPAPRRRLPESLAARNQRLYGARDGAELLQVYRHLAAASGTGSRAVREDATADSPSLRCEAGDAVEPKKKRQGGREDRERERSEEGLQLAPSKRQARGRSLPTACQGPEEGTGNGRSGAAAAVEETGCLAGGKREMNSRSRVDERGSSDAERRRWDRALQVLAKLKMGHSCEAIFLGLGDLSFASRKKLFFRRHFDFRWTSKKKLSGELSGTAATGELPAAAARAADSNAEGCRHSETPSGALGSTGTQERDASPSERATAAVKEETSGLDKEGRVGGSKKEDENASTLALPPAKRSKRSHAGTRSSEVQAPAPWSVLADHEESQSLFLTSWPSLSPQTEPGADCVSSDSKESANSSDYGGLRTVSSLRTPRPYRPLCLLSLLQRSRAVRRARFLRYLLEQMEPQSSSLLHLLLLKGQLRVKCDHDSDRRVEFDRHVSWLLSRLPGDPQLLRYAWWGRGGSPGLQRGLQISQKRGDLALQWIPLPSLSLPPSLYPTSLGNASRSGAWHDRGLGGPLGLQTCDELGDSFEDAHAVGAAVAAAAAGALSGSTPGVRWGGGLLSGSEGDTETGKGAACGAGSVAALGSTTAVGPFASGLQGGGPVLGASQRRLLSLFRRVCPADVLCRGLATGSVSLSWPTATELQVLRLPELLLDQQVMRLGDTFVWSFEGWVANLVAVAPFLGVCTPHRRAQIGIKKRLGVRQLPNALLTKGSPPPSDFDETHSGVSTRLPANAASLPLSPFPESAETSSMRGPRVGPPRKRGRKAREN
ncbi:hypothetical protein TGMAS_234990 [Toxoplasma gondii MAS]|uniref:Uncharacterized protein n=1 Tax=Toxoplasma gondii MAS TaxID=943118 RepID=A0A086Q5F5_TOXGO|nr:hypothetical protein TGMAS_234990 [Toxoplasma gondii MAS]